VRGTDEPEPPRDSQAVAPAAAQRSTDDVQRLRLIHREATAWRRVAEARDRLARADRTWPPHMTAAATRAWRDAESDAQRISGEVIQALEQLARGRPSARPSPNPPGTSK
jgi:hypothetical protein